MFIPLSKELKFSTKHKQTLQNLVIDEHNPGTILRNFDMLLDFLRPDELPITPSHQLPMRIVTEINQRLTHPLQLGLKRPVQKSYPHIQGLYLLLRASGLTYVSGNEAKPVLVLEPKAYSQWTSLNPTERYGTLLETWLLRGRGEIIGEHDGLGLIPDNFERSASFYITIPSSGMSVVGNHDTEERLKYYPLWHNLGLMDLFGLINIQRGRSEPGQGWQIERIQRTPYGDALLALLYSGFFADTEKIFQIEEQGNMPFDSLRPLLQPYFPQWQHNLSAPEWAFREGTYRFKVVQKSIWRRIAIDAAQSLDELAMIILKSVKFDNDHLYQFAYETQFGSVQEISHPYTEEVPDTSEVKVGELPLRIGQTMTYLFDFGDNWEFDVILEAIDTGKRIKKARILETYGEAPEQYPNWDE